MNKRVLLLLTVSLTFLFSCTDNTAEIIEERKEINESLIQSNEIDPIKDCPQNDRNCNGVPDSEE